MPPAVLPGMIARGFGRIVTIASTAGLKGYAYVTAYCAAKHAVVGLVRSLAVETATSGVTVNAVCPGYTDTELVRESVAAHHRQDRPVARRTCSPHYVKDMPIGRLIQPQEVAAAVLYLCSPEPRPSPARRSRSPAERSDGRSRRMPLDAETKVAERPDDHKAELRLWLRLLTCTTLIESEVRRRLRDSFDVTLPRFDLMAQLDRAPNGMTLGELSQRMMVSNGNVTGLVERLVEQGLIDRRPAPNDRRAQIVTPHRRGAPNLPRHGARQRRLDRRDFRRTLTPDEIETLMPLLAKTKASARKAIGNGGPR